MSGTGDVACPGVTTPLSIFGGLYIPSSQAFFSTSSLLAVGFSPGDIGDCLWPKHFPSVAQGQGNVT